MKPLGNRPHGRLQHTVDAVLHVHPIVLRLDVDVARATLDGGVNGGVHQANDRTAVAGQPLDGQVLIAQVIVFEDLDLELLGRLIEHALRAFALLQHALDRRPRADHHPYRGAEDHAELVDHRQVGGIRDDNHQRAAVAAVRHEAVTQHQVRGNRSEQFLINPEVVHVQEIEPIAFRQAAGRGLFGAALFGRDLRRGRRLIDQRRRVEGVVRAYIHVKRPFVISGCPSRR